jgi:hypothetical protein
MYRVDLVHGCLDPSEVLTAVCGTSVNRCGGSEGLGSLCAFSPDGGVFVEEWSDNDWLTRQGWRFTGGENVPDFALDAQATTSEVQQCYSAQCMKLCSGAAAPT